MWNRKIRKSTRLSVLALLFCLLSAFGTCSQAERMYTISEGELNQLQSNLTELKADSGQKQNLLTEQQKQLQIVNEQLGKSRKLNEETQTSLAEARKSFSEYEKEAERKIRIKTRQRDAWEAATAILFGVLVKKEIVK